MTRKRIPYRALLPFIFGVVSAGLICWAVRMDAACRFYDDGRPFWPCEFPSALINWLSAPGIAFFGLIFSWWHSYDLARYLAEWPFILLWWWFAGTRLDFGLLGAGRYRWRKTWIAGLLGLALVLTGLGADCVRNDLARHKQVAYPASSHMLRTLFGLIWCFGLAWGCAVAAVQLWRNKLKTRAQTLVTRSTLQHAVLCALIYALLVVGLSLHERAKERRLEEEYARRQISVEGRILDDTGSAVKGVEVEIIPLFKDGDARWEGTARAWTDAQGAYRLTPGEAGEYLLGSMIDEAPYASQPFETKYYRDTETAASATTIKLVNEQHLRVAPMRLHRIPLISVPVEVVWANGSHEPNASILFQNPLFPNEAGIGSASVLPDKEGQIRLPAGYDYFAIASVQCDAGTKIESRETDRVRLSTKAGSDLSRRIRLTLSGVTCKRWQPQ